MSRAALKLAPVVDPRRTALAEAIAAVRARQGEYEAVEKAHRQAEEQFYALLPKESEAEAAVEKARTDAVEHLTAVHMGVASEAPKTMQQARAELQDIKDRIEAARAARDGLKAKLDTMPMSAGSVVSIRLNDAHAAFVWGASETMALRKRLEAVEAERATLKAVMGVLFSAHVTPWNMLVDTIVEPDAGVVANWRHAVAALRTDPDAKLPEVR